MEKPFSFLRQPSPEVPRIFCSPCYTDMCIVKKKEEELPMPEKNQRGADRQEPLSDVDDLIFAWTRTGLSATAKRQLRQTELPFTTPPGVRAGAPGRNRPGVAPDSRNGSRGRAVPGLRPGSTPAGSPGGAPDRNHEQLPRLVAVDARLLPRPLHNAAPGRRQRLQFRPGRGEQRARKALLRPAVLQQVF